ncbi:MAG: anhydro-N-acetylmuramic acid kinase [Bacteroidota bacterium]
MTKNSYLAIGQMSGTSLDGMDLAAVEFKKSPSSWHYRWVATETLPYPVVWEDKLRNAPNLPATELMELHAAYGHYLGDTLASFLHTHNLTPDIIACHGHTVFHRPERGYSTQIGDGWPIAYATNSLTATDFRTADIALGGQGAPLVPIGDELLFGNYSHCLNLGGFSNVSFRENNQRVAFDICPVNLVLNAFARKQGVPYDKEGALGRQGTVNSTLLETLNALPFYEQKMEAKSLGKEWLDKAFMPVVEAFDLTLPDTMATLYEHMGMQIGKSLQHTGEGQTLVTGGGAYNTYLLKRIKAYTTAKLEVPDNRLVDYKEALIFAFMGVLRLRNEINCLASATGAARSSCCGTLHIP